MPKQFDWVYSRKEGQGVVVERDESTQSLYVFWNSGHSSKVFAKDIIIGNRPKK